jgi:hypothetical protein
MTILNLLNRIFTADQTPNNTVSWSGTNGLKGIQDDIAEEIRARGCIVLPNTTELNNQGKNNSQNAIVQGIGVYTWFPTTAGPANGFYVVGANDGGFWVLQETTTTFLPDLLSTPNPNPNGIVLFNSGGVLKYITSTGSIKTVTVTP